MKRCRSCKKVKPAQDFPLRSLFGPKRRQGICYDCYHEERGKSAYETAENQLAAVVDIFRTLTGR